MERCPKRWFYGWLAFGEIKGVAIAPILCQSCHKTHVHGTMENKVHCNNLFNKTHTLQHWNSWILVIDLFKWQGQLIKWMKATLECALWLCLLFHIFFLWFPSKYHHLFTISMYSSPFQTSSLGKKLRQTKWTIFPCFLLHFWDRFGFSKETLLNTRREKTKQMKYRKP